jgi:hypothetical protein
LVSRKKIKQQSKTPQTIHLQRVSDNVRHVEALTMSFSDRKTAQSKTIEEERAQIRSSPLSRINVTGTLHDATTLVVSHLTIDFSKQARGLPYE